MANKVYLNKEQFHQLIDTDVSVQTHMNFYGKPPDEWQRDIGFITLGGITFYCNELLDKTRGVA